MPERFLDIDNVARIGLMYIDGDKLEDVLVDKLTLDYDNVNYDHICFNDLKIAVLKLERINPDLSLTAILWQLRPDNRELVVPVLAGSALPEEGWEITEINSEMKKVFETGMSQTRKRAGTCSSFYYPVRSSNADIVGVLELLHGRKHRKDI
jgi:hypothetical protein